MKQQSPTSSSKSPSWLPFALFGVFACAVFGLGSYKIVRSAHGMLQAVRAQSWQEGSARVLEAKMVPKKKTRRKGSWRINDTVQVHYQFQALGRTYHGNTIHIEYDGYQPKEKHSQIFARLKAARQVRVFYNPEHPDQNALSRGVNEVLIQQFCIGLILILFAGLISLVLIGPFTRRWYFAPRMVVIPSNGASRRSRDR
ncbi:DUF3592 domain-containing protein [Verrucomicrobium sp. BvORR106]|uniref:DUF3592 domain-containing protein n=1 Tax=Verrucomicrobium sp. BvORR106 TaxID=1403819 RepID=UPI0009DF6CF1|nr:DUF3592 domain-containing protein [Verrucomicrobium sp. BvORR106]